MGASVRDCCGGIFVARDGVHLAAVRVERMELAGNILIPTVDLLGVKSLRASSCVELLEALNQAGVILAQTMGDACGAIGIAGFGPFYTLDPKYIGQELSVSKYGRLRPNPWNGLSDVSLPEIVSQGYSEVAISAPPCVVRSDVEAGAIGEAWYRGAAPDDVTAYLMLTEGIGGAFARGLTPLGGALHSEVGLVPVSKKPGDVLSTIKGYKGREWNVGLCANTSSLLARARKLGHEKRLGRELTTAELLGIEDDRLWSVWSNYIAQVCIICTVILPPRWIILAGPLMARPRSLHGVRGEFNRLWERRSRAPAFNYPAFEKSDFISLATSTKQRALMPEVAGAIYAAASHMSLGQLSEYRKERRP